MKQSYLVYADQLAIFDKPSQPIGVRGCRYIQYLPVNSFSDQSVIEFNIPGNTAYYTDLKRTRLHVSCKIVKQDGTAMSSGAGAGHTNASLIDNGLSSLFSRVDVLFQDKTMTSSDNTYPYLAYLTNVLYRSSAQKQTDLRTELFYQDPGSAIADINYLTSECEGLKERGKLFENSNVVDMVGSIYSDVCMNLDRYIPSGVDIKVKLYPSAPEFALVSSDLTQKFKIIILKAFLTGVHINVSPEVAISHNEILKTSPAIFPYIRTVVRKYTLPANIFSYDISDPFNGSVPAELIAGLVSESAQYGSLRENPYLFEPANLNYITAQWDSIDIPPGGMRPKYDDSAEKSNYIDAYNSFRGINNDGDCIPFTRQDFHKGYNLYRFHTECPGIGSNGTIPVKRSGCLRISMTFAKKLAKGMTLILFARFPAAFEIDSSRAVYDV